VAADAILEETRDVILLHCVSAYPAPLEQLNLRVISALRGAFGVPVGFSDHTLGSEAACAALALGARVFEKHVTLSRGLPGPDHQASSEPQELARYVQTLRSMMISLGDGRKRVMPCEENTRDAFRRYLVVERSVGKGQSFSESDFAFMKVASGIAPHCIELIVGKKARVDVQAGTVFRWELLDTRGVDGD